jgi:hypothetical protein
MFLLFIVQAAAEPQPALHLTCVGAGTANKVAVSTINTNSNAYGTLGSTPFYGNSNGSGTIYRQRQQDFADQVDLRLFEGDDRIRLPRTMLPPIRGGKDGWFKLKNVVTDSRSIRAKAAVNFMNSPNIFVDRLTGTISISGKAGDYTGQCQAVSTDALTKF